MDDQIVGFLINGAVGAVPLILISFLLARFTKPAYSRGLLAAVLVGAALAYVYFAWDAGAGPAWLAAELLGVALYGGMAVRGVRGSHWWLAAAWLMHPLWDVLLHFIGPGHSFAPVSYVIACLSYDLIVAGYVALAYRSRVAHRTAATALAR